MSKKIRSIRLVDLVHTLRSINSLNIMMYPLRVGMIRSSLTQARRFSTTRPAQTKVAVLGAAGTHIPHSFFNSLTRSIVFNDHK